MTSTADPAAELAKLAHQLGVDAEDVAFLDAVPAADLRTLRTAIGEALFQSDRHHFSRMVALARAVPVPLAARISVLALPPLLAARSAELFEPDKAVELVGRLPVDYLTAVSSAMDPARSPEVIAAMPPDTVAAVGRRLAERREWVVMGAFVSHVGADALATTVRELTGEQLLHVGYVLDDLDRVGEITDALADGQLDDVLAAAAELELWAELDQLLGALDAERAGRLARRCAAAPDVRDRLAAGPLTHRAVLGLS